MKYLSFAIICVVLILGILLLFSCKKTNTGLTFIKTFGGESYDYAKSVQPTSDGGYIIAGSTNSFGAGEYDVYFIKTDANGNIE